MLRNIKHVCKFNDVITPHTHPKPTCYVTSNMCASSTMSLHLCSLLIYTPSSVRHRPRRNRCVFSCKIRLAFILTVNLHVRACRPRRNRCVFSCKMRLAFLDCKFICRPRQPRRNPCVFSCKMRLAFILTANLNATPANPGEILAFSHVKSAWAPFWLKIYNVSSA